MEIDCCPSCKNLIKLGNQLKLNTEKSNWEDGYGCPYCDNFFYSKRVWNESRQDYEAGNRFSPMPWPD